MLTPSTGEIRRLSDITDQMLYRVTSLAYDPATDRLKGIYYQAVVKQKFKVSFVRK